MSPAGTLVPDLEALNLRDLADAEEAERKAAALLEWARRIRETVARNRQAMAKGWAFASPPSLRKIEDNIRRRGKRPAPRLVTKP